MAGHPPWALTPHPFPCVSLCCRHSVNSASGKTSTAVCTAGGISNRHTELPAWAVTQPAQGRVQSLEAEGWWAQHPRPLLLPLLAGEGTEAQRGWVTSLWSCRSSCAGQNLPVTPRLLGVTVGSSHREDSWPPELARPGPGGSDQWHIPCHRSSRASCSVLPGQEERDCWDRMPASRWAAAPGRPAQLRVHWKCLQGRRPARFLALHVPAHPHPDRGTCGSCHLGSSQSLCSEKPSPGFRT